MARYECEEIRLPGGEQAFRIVDHGAGVDATAVPERGALWSSLGIRQSSGARVELLHAANDFTTGGCSPVLFPVTGRSWCDGELGAYRHGGVVRPMPIHGFAQAMPWQVAAAGGDGESAFVTCVLTDTEQTRALYPYPFRVSLTYRLRDGEFLIEATVENPGNLPLPFHLGYHPYFRTPVLPDGDRRRCVLAVPSTECWELNNLCATGTRRPLSAAEAFDPARPLGEDTLDRVFADLRPDPTTGLIHAWVRDPDAGCTVEVRYDAALYPVFVVYTAPEAPYVCLEPWTGLPGGLGDDTPAGQGARRVPPGGRYQATVAVKAFFS